MFRWIPGIPPSDGLLGDFVKDLGPGQIAGRQVLASPVMGEIQLSLLDNRGALEVEVIRAKGLIPKPGSKLLPGIISAGSSATMLTLGQINDTFSSIRESVSPRWKVLHGESQDIHIKKNPRALLSTAAGIR